MDKLNRLVKLCKGRVSLQVNPHKDEKYTSVSNYLKEMKEKYFIDKDEISAENEMKMIGKDCIIRLMFKPEIESYFEVIYGSDLEKVLDEALSTFIGWKIVDPKIFTLLDSMIDFPHNYKIKTHPKNEESYRLLESVFDGNRWSHFTIESMDDKPHTIKHVNDLYYKSKVS